MSSISIIMSIKETPVRELVRPLVSTVGSRADEEELHRVVLREAARLEEAGLVVRTPLAVHFSGARERRIADNIQLDNILGRAGP